MIPAFLQALAQAQSRTGLSRRALCAGLPYATILRWSARSRRGQELLQKPGPKKTQPLDWKTLLPKLQQLDHARQRTHGTTALLSQYQEQLSRRHFQILVKGQPAQHFETM